MDCMLKMKQIYTQLTAKERLVADYIQAFPNQAVSLSVQELAIRSQSSTASVMRMVKKLGYDSFPIFKIELAKSGEPKEPPRDFIIKCKDSLPLISEKIHHATENAIRELVNTLDFRKLSAAVEKLRHAERIFLLGTGGSGIPASDLYQKLVRDRPAGDLPSGPASPGVHRGSFPARGRCGHLLLQRQYGRRSTTPPGSTNKTALIFWV